MKPIMRRLPGARLALAGLLAAGLGLVIDTTPTASADGEGTATLHEATAIGAKLPRLQTKDIDDQAFDSNALDAPAAAVEAHVRKVAQAAGASADCPWSTPLRELSGVKSDDGEVDDDLVLALVNRAGSQFGRIATEEQLAGLTTLGDLKTWAGGASGQPTVYIAWSPKCPTCKKLNERLQGVLAATGVRAFAVLVNKPDDVASVRLFQERYGLPLRVLQDPDFVLGSALGAEHTPHFILVDKGGVVRYRGGLDNDLYDVMEGEEREDWLKDAIAAVRAGQPVEKTETAPFG
ncbi:MAG: redoxin domain-containing protein [Planctomycetes bacterium]|nr:redoxin domain-containing protein [Planctomycetota bacterium]